MRNKLIQFSTLLLLLFSTQVISNPINKIVFTGLNNSSEIALLKLIPLKVGQNFSTSSSDEIIKSLFITGLFENISINKKGKTLEIKLTENPQIKFIDLNSEYKKNFSTWLKNEKKLISNEEFIEYTTKYKLAIGETFTKQKLSEFIQFLENKYSEFGYFGVEIKPVLVVDLQNRIGIDLQLTQGERATIKSLKILLLKIKPF